MKNLLAAILVVAPCLAAPAAAECTRIQSGNLRDTANNPITVGYDVYGYNYQAHLFNGLYENFSRPEVPVTAGDVSLRMKWSDDWLANRDCTGDLRLDRGLDSSTGQATGTSMGWLTNHIEGDCINAAGESVHATYFAKIVWVGPAQTPDPWAANRIWGEYAIIEEVGEDPSGGVCSGAKGLNRANLTTPRGFGAY